MAQSKPQKAIVAVDVNIAEAIETLRYAGNGVSAKKVLSNVGKRLGTREDGLMLDQLVLAGQKNKGFIGCINARFCDVLGTTLEGIPMHYSKDYGFAGIYIRAYDKPNLLVIAASDRIAEVWYNALSDARTQTHWPRYEVTRLY